MRSKINLLPINYVLDFSEWPFNYVDGMSGWSLETYICAELQIQINKNMGQIYVIFWQLFLVLSINWELFYRAIYHLYEEVVWIDLTIKIVSYCFFILVVWLRVV
jgi:hypothetical protein